MKARERLYLVVLAIIFGVAAVLVGGTALEFFSVELLRTCIDAVRGQWEYMLLAVILLALAVYFLLSSMRRGQERVETLTVQGALGELRISFKAVENLVLKAARSNKGVREIKTRITHTEQGLIIYLRAVTVPDLNIPEITAELQTAVKEYVETTTGRTVAEIKVLIENVVSSDVANAAR